MNREERDYLEDNCDCYPAPRRTTYRCDDGLCGASDCVRCGDDYDDDEWDEDDDDYDDVDDDFDWDGEE